MWRNYDSSVKRTTKMMIRYLLILIFLLVGFEEHTCRRSRKGKPPKTPYKYEVHQSSWIPSDIQITAFLRKDEPKTFFYWSSDNNRSLHIILMACTSITNWTMFHLSTNNETLSVDTTKYYYNERTEDISIKNILSLKGVYVLSVLSTSKDTFLHIYISTENAGPQALIYSRRYNLKMSKKGKKDLLTIKWEPSSVDPQRTDYCLAINTEKHYKTMCAAEQDTIGDNELWANNLDPERIKNPTLTLECVGHRTHVNIPTIIQGQLYYFDLFAINKQSNFTYLLDYATKKIDLKNKFVTLKDGKFANIKKITKKAIFKFKVGKHAGDHLNLYIIPCGNYIYLDIKLKQVVVIRQVKIESFKNITIPNVIKGNRYIIKVIIPQDNFIHTGVEILATTKPYVSSPLPTLPQNTSVIEYESLKRCDSVTIGWMPSPNEASVTYCLVVKEGNIKEIEEYNPPNLCGLENRLKKSLDFALKYCMPPNKKNQSIITEKITNLRSGRSYTILVTIKKPKGRTLSYNVLSVDTLSSCQINSY
ncbi:neuron derived neurotrophic factor nord isoform X1 [Rhynchophorus ferrugineus]|uniref:neuron derived neurotrophic factor nord isoform X1 n=2 Tax=Rhynchophorus ferrugineus TaxID=354439 RepID=UPI003FCEDE63